MLTWSACVVRAEDVRQLLDLPFVAQVLQGSLMWLVRFWSAGRGQFLYDMRDELRTRLRRIGSLKGQG